MTPGLLDQYTIQKQPIESTLVYGILGVINLHAGLYIILIKKRTLVGLIDGHPIYKVSEPLIHKVSNKTSKDNKETKEEQENQLSQPTQTNNFKSESGEKVR